MSTLSAQLPHPILLLQAVLAAAQSVLARYGARNPVLVPYFMAPCQKFILPVSPLPAAMDYTQPLRVPKLGDRNWRKNKAKYYQHSCTFCCQASLPALQARNHCEMTMCRQGPSATLKQQKADQQLSSLQQQK